MYPASAGRNYLLLTYDWVVDDTCQLLSTVAQTSDVVAEALEVERELYGVEAPADGWRAVSVAIAATQRERNNWTSSSSTTVAPPPWKNHSQDR